MKRSIILAAGVAATAVAAGCSSGGPDQRQPGEWETITEIKALEVPGAAPDMQARARAQIGQSQTARECLTEEAARDPIRQLRQMMAQGPSSNCQFSDQVFRGGTIRIRATCAAAGGGGSAEFSVDGGFTAITLESTVIMNAQGAGVASVPGATGMRLTANVRGRRVGDCPVGARPGNSQ